MAFITLLTDFGDKDYYVGLFKGDLYTASPSSRIVDISHAIPPYDIVTAAFFLKNVFPHYPQGSIHIVRVFEQGLGKQKLLAAKYRNAFFIAPDNGILSLVFEEKPELLVEVDLKQVKLPSLEDYYCRVVKEIVFNKSIGQIGTVATRLVERKSLQPLLEPHRIVGNILHVDNFGNVITNIRREDLDRYTGRMPRINYRMREYIDGIVEDYNDVKPSYKLARFNSIGYLEICINCGNASMLLGLENGNAIQIEFE